MHATKNDLPADDAKDAQATLFEIQRLSTEDGPGIRTTVFFKGCSLACAWCHNPESISARPQLHWIASRCIGCGTCGTVCPEDALRRSADGIAIDRVHCTTCGACAAECPSTAMEIIGTRWHLDALVHEVLKDQAYFASSGGGVTAGGGEPGLQASFLSAFLQALKQANIHTAVDTCGCYPVQSLDAFLPFTDLVLYDLKEIDPERHRAFTGRGNARILDNLRTIGARMVSGAAPQELWIRTPVIPQATATEANIAGIGQWLAAELQRHGCALGAVCLQQSLPGQIPAARSRLVLQPPAPADPRRVGTPGRCGPPFRGRSRHRALERTDPEPPGPL
jgi:pyruvate formate lyase activating enzyme